MDKLPKTFCSILTLGGLLLATGCFDSAPDPMAQARAAEGDQTAGQTPDQAMATLASASGSDVQGTVYFRRQDDGVQVLANLSGLGEGEHGLHVHQYGDCSAADASSAGGHLNPHDTEHGAPGDGPGERHVGDLGNVEAGEQGKAQYERVDSLITLEGTNSILGKAVVVHSGEDDLTSQPSGDAGMRVACGVIQARSAGDAAGREDTASR